MGISVLVFGLVYWAAWRIFLPKIFRYDLVTTKEELVDGTIITVVRLSFISQIRATLTSKQSINTRNGIE